MRGEKVFMSIKNAEFISKIQIESIWRCPWSAPPPPPPNTCCADELLLEVRTPWSSHALSCWRHGYSKLGSGQSDIICGVNGEVDSSFRAVDSVSSSI